MNKIESKRYFKDKKKTNRKRENKKERRKVGKYIYIKCYDTKVGLVKSKIEKHNNN
jgi:hypothetical protein